MSREGQKHKLMLCHGKHPAEEPARAFHGKSSRKQVGLPVHVGILWSGYTCISLSKRWVILHLFHNGNIHSPFETRLLSKKQLFKNKFLLQCGHYVKYDLCHFYPCVFISELPAAKCKDSIVPDKSKDCFLIPNFKLTGVSKLFWFQNDTVTNSLFCF